MNLLILNIKTDSTDHVLGFTTDWINELAKHFERVFVISIHVGKVEVADNVEVFGLQSLSDNRVGKFKRAVNLYKIFFKIIRQARIDVCFSHMNIVFPLLLFPFLKCRKIPMAQWYAHRQVSWMLKIIHLVSDRIFTTSNRSFNLESKKKIIFGHAISTNKFYFYPKAFVCEGPYKIATVGRVSRIKRLEIILQALHCASERGLNLIVDVIGSPITSEDHLYLAELKILVNDLGLEGRVNFLGAIPFKEVSGLVRSAMLCINAAPTGAFDKAVFESWSTGTPCLITNESFSEILVDTSFSFLLRKPDPEDICNGMEYLIRLGPNEFAELCAGISRLVDTKFSLHRVCGDIGMQLRMLTIG